MNRSRLILPLNALLVFLVLTVNFLYLKSGFDAFLKFLASFLFVLLGSVNFLLALRSRQKQLSFYSLSFVGLFLAFSGDLLILKSFLWGAGAFALCHVFFFTACCVLFPFRWTDALFALALFLFSSAVLIFFPFRFSPPFLFGVCLLYGAVISLMLSKALGNFLRCRRPAFLSFFLGALLFYLSDLFLCVAHFSDIMRQSSILCMALYYPALCLMAVSMYLKTRLTEN